MVCYLISKHLRWMHSKIVLIFINNMHEKRLMQPMSENNYFIQNIYFNLDNNVHLSLQYYN